MSKRNRKAANAKPLSAVVVQAPEASPAKPVGRPSAVKAMSAEQRTREIVALIGQLADKPAKNVQKGLRRKLRAFGHFGGLMTHDVAIIDKATAHAKPV